jgi:hypothetical protein
MQGHATGRSVYEGRYERDEDEEWTPVGEFDDTGRFLVQPGWARRAQGWVPLSDRLPGR